MRSALAFAALTLLSACTPPAAQAPAPAAGSDAGGGSAEPLVSTLSVEPTPDSVRLMLQVTNATGGPLTLEFRSGQSFDFSVSEDGRMLWRWSQEMMFTQALRSETLAAGETRAYDAVWHPSPELRGRLLSASAHLAASNHPVERTQAFRLP
jgi:hypothetical protein